MNPQLLIAEAKVIYLNKTRIQKKQCSIYISIILGVCQLFTCILVFAFAVYSNMFSDFAVQ